MFKSTQISYNEDYFNRIFERLHRDRYDGVDITKKYEFRIKGVGCYWHQDIQYTIFFREKASSKIIQVSSNKKTYFDQLRDFFPDRNFDMYKRCSRCPTIRDGKNSIALAIIGFLILISIYNYLFLITNYQSILLNSALLWFIAQCLIFYGEHIDTNDQGKEISETISSTIQIIALFPPVILYALINVEKLQLLNIITIMEFIGLTLLFFVILPFPIRSYLRGEHSFLYRFLGLRPVNEGSLFPHFD